jgi:hypothetical protein
VSYLTHDGKSHGTRGYVCMAAYFLFSLIWYHFVFSTTCRYKKLTKKMMKKIGKPLTQKIIDECNGKEEESLAVPVQTP